MHNSYQTDQTHHRIDGKQTARQMRRSIVHPAEPSKTFQLKTKKEGNKKNAGVV